MLSMAAMVACSGGSRDKVGNQPNADPVAAAVVIGAAPDNALTASDGVTTYRVRAGSDVVISAKDSDGIDAPILTYQWQQVDSTPYKVTLYERTSNSRAFTAPKVTTETKLEFQVTVTDSNSKTATQKVQVLVTPILDANRFLVLPEFNEMVYFYVSPASGKTLTTNDVFSLKITPVVSWTDRDGNHQQHELDATTFNGTLPSGFVGTASPTNSSNVNFEYRIPLLDADEVNKYFQGDKRAGRLEPELVSTAKLNLKVELTSLSGLDAYDVYVAAPDQTVVPSSSIFTDAGAITGSAAPSQPQPSNNAILATNESILYNEVSVEKIRENIGVESVRSAENYYNCIDPKGEAKTLKDWLFHHGFADASGNLINKSAVTHATYINNYDLGFGRDMYLRKDTDGSVYTYVVNYPTLENAIQGRNEFATVVMEYSAAPTGKCGDGTFSDTQKIVKFYAYVPDTTTGEMVRSATMNFDGRGERSLPGVCMACHMGRVDADALNVADLTSIDATKANLDASFMPWDLDSFLYTEAQDAKLVDPDFNRSDFTAQQILDYSRESQEEAFRKLNEGTLATYIDNRARYEEPLRLIHGWYGNSDALPAEDATAAERDDNTSPLDGVDPTILTTLPDVPFDGSYVQPGWKGHEDLYFGFYARNCRLCHVQQETLAVNFESYNEFVYGRTEDTSAGVSPTLINYVYNMGLMPLSRQTADRFWMDFYGSDTAPADILTAQLKALGATISGVPGDAVAQLTVTPSPVTSIPQTVTLDGSNSSFADSYLWQVNSESSCTDTPTIDNPTAAVTSFVATVSPCSYNVSLTVANDRNSDTATSTLLVDRTPKVGSTFVADLSSYTPGDSSLVVDILGTLASQVPAPSMGDGGVSVVVNDNSAQYGLPIDPNLSNNNDGTVTYSFAPLYGVNSTSISYRLVDSNGSISSNIGTATVDIPAIVATLSLDSVTATSASISWTVPAGFVADQYKVYRDSSLIGNTAGNVLAYNDTGLSPNGNYSYNVTAMLSGSESNGSNDLPVSTSSGVPTGLTSGTITSTSLQFTWSDGAGTPPNPDSYNIYVDSSKVASAQPGYSYTATGLSANTSYNLQVSANFGATETGLSSALARTTLPGVPTLTAIGSLGSTNYLAKVTRTSVTLNWSAPSGGADSYDVYVNGGLNQNVNGLTATVSGLSAGTAYSFKVRARNSAGQSSDSNSINTTTLVTYTSDISNLNFIISQGCSGCHSLPAQLTAGVDVNNCIANGNLDLGECSGFYGASDMSGFSLTSGEKSLIQLWRSEGEQ